MNKLELLNKAVEMGAKLEVKFHHIDSREKAIEIMEQLTTTYKAGSNQGTNWLGHVDYENQMEFVVFYEDSKDAKIRQLEEEIKKLKEE